MRILALIQVRLVRGFYIGCIQSRAIGVDYSYSPLAFHQRERYNQPQIFKFYQVSDGQSLSGCLLFGYRKFFQEF
jgi:hypothetical protein